ncbi:hypothetical protein Goklo_017759 [Gossypium klotzschianum]|uniref:Uncharacterized protein n=1 Tax=Gossypium klotzschianum TaxID=34286 RepID=A0A7J8UJ99_9ROSI|nr:hypothetical protein [Gossypium klotzschianum]
MGLSESLGDNSRDHSVKRSEEEESVQDREDTFISESKLAMRPGSKKVSKERQGWKDEEINMFILEKSNDNGGYENTLQNMLRLEEEHLSGMRAKPRLGEKDKNGYNNWAMEDVSNMGFLVVELGLENMERAQDEHREIEEGVGLMEAKNAWEVGKKLGFSVTGDEREVVDGTMRLEERHVLGYEKKSYSKGLICKGRVDLCFIHESKIVMVIEDIIRKGFKKFMIDYNFGVMLDCVGYWWFWPMKCISALEDEVGCGGVLKDDK